MVQVTEIAKKKVIDLMQEDGFDAKKDFVRVGVKSGGCSGLSYELKFDNQTHDGDKVFEDNGVKIIVDKKSFLYLVGTTLD
ncbi:MAG: iron-sulfur cluster assembly accessory protein, partial [Lutimonas sp.]